MMNVPQITIPKEASSSFSIRKDIMLNIHNRWHCHEEMEIICIHKGIGTQYVGDSVSTFLPGDVVFIGADLPHYWHYDDEEEICSAEMPYTTTLHFKADFMGQAWLNLPETKALKVLFAKATRGIVWRGGEASHIAAKVEQLYHENGFRRMLLLLDCLQTMLSCQKLTLLCSMGFQVKNVIAGSDRINAVYNYILDNFQKSISLEEVAEVADLSPNSFCRYFKLTTGKTFGQFVQDVRIGYACRLILDNQLSVKQVCYSSGFRNYTSFHEAFKANTGKTPKTYFGQHQRG